MPTSHFSRAVIGHCSLVTGDMAMGLWEREQVLYQVGTLAWLLQTYLLFKALVFTVKRDWQHNKETVSSSLIEIPGSLTFTLQIQAALAEKKSYSVEGGQWDFIIYLFIFCGQWDFKRFSWHVSALFLPSVAQQDSTPEELWNRITKKQ